MMPRAEGRRTSVTGGRIVDPRYASDHDVPAVSLPHLQNLGADTWQTIGDAASEAAFAVLLPEPLRLESQIHDSSVTGPQSHRGNKEHRGRCARVGDREAVAQMPRPSAALASRRRLFIHLGKLDPGTPGSRPADRSLIEAPLPSPPRTPGSERDGVQVRLRAWRDGCRARNRTCVVTSANERGGNDEHGGLRRFLSAATGYS
ncbi:hypothetical protein C8R46DRAFT_344730 [Mycena filopes]|nr:hypothetical protein C8R46DRAFT_344730 [Mycena filopes]